MTTRGQQLYKMKIADSSDSITFWLLDVPIVKKDVGGTATNTTIDGNIYTDYMWLKDQWEQKWSIMCKDEYDKLHGIFERQFTNAEVPNLKIFYGNDIHTDGNAEGQSFQITNDSEAYDGEILDFSLYGNAEQKTLTGTNLFNTLDKIAESPNINLVVYDNNNIKMTNNGTNAWLGVKYQISNLKANTDYSLCYTQINTNSSMINWAWALGADDNTMLLNTSYTSGSKASFNTGVNTSVIIQLYVQTQTGTVTTNTATISNIQLNEGNTLKDYEPYCGGSPMPNPDFPSPVETVTGRQEVRICGKNLFDNSLLAKGSVTVTDGVATGTATQFYSAWAGTSGFIDTYPDGRITISAEAYTDGNDSTASTVGLRIAINYTDGTRDFATWHNNDLNYVKQSVVSNQSKTIGSIAFTYNSSAQNIWHVRRLQIEQGTTATEYEPYQAQSYELNLGKNLFDSELEQGSYSGTTGAKTVDNTIYRSADKISVEPNTTYTLSLNGVSQKYVVLFYDDSEQYISQNASLTSGTFTTLANAHYIAIRCFASDYTSDFANLKLQLEFGGLATPYSAYKTPIELAKIGTYQDYIYKDGGKWYKHAEINKIVLDGTENWGGLYQNTAGLWTSNSPIATEVVQGNNVGISDHFMYKWSYNSNTPCFYVYNQGGQGRIMLIQSVASDSATFTSWLESNTPAVYYILATPTDTEITDSELVGQLNALLEGSLYKGLNNVFLIPSAGADGTMTMEYRIAYEKETIVQDTTPVKLDLTDGGIINACLCRQNVQVIMRETKDSSES